jgi:septum formation protein
MSADIYLASASPRRRELLKQIGIESKFVPVDVDETPKTGEPPTDYVLRLAHAKAEAANRLLDHPPLPILAADTAVVLGDQILGKPRNRSRGIDMLRQLSGTRHEVLTAVVLIADKVETRLSRSLVTFRKISDREARGYWDSGEPGDKAGGYAIQGQAAVFISGLSGSYSGVMGLPLFETAELLQNVGICPLKNRP